MVEKSTIQISKETRNELVKIGKKNETYDQLIYKLILEKRKMDSLDIGSANLQHSSESTISQ